MAWAFSYNQYECIAGQNTVVSGSASAIQLKNLGPAVVYVSDDHYLPTVAGTHGWPLAPGDTVRVPGGNACLSLSSVQDDGFRAQVVAIEED